MSRCLRTTLVLVRKSIFLKRIIHKRICQRLRRRGQSVFTHARYHTELQPPLIDAVDCFEETLHLSQIELAVRPNTRTNVDAERDRKSTRLNSSHGYISY